MLLSASTPRTGLIKAPVLIRLLPSLTPVAAQTREVGQPTGLAPQNASAGQVNGVLYTGQGASGSAVATPTLVRVVAVPTPTMSLEFAPSGNNSSPSPVLGATPVATTMGPAQGPGSSSSGTEQDPEQAELTPQGMKQLTVLPWKDEAEVSGTLQPAQDWMTYAIPVGPMTLSLRVTVSQVGPFAGPAIPAYSISFTSSAPRERS